MTAEARLINLHDYPIHEPESDAYKDLLNDVRQDLLSDGCSVLKGFLGSSPLC